MNIEYKHLEIVSRDKIQSMRLTLNDGVVRRTQPSPTLWDVNVMNICFFRPNLLDQYSLQAQLINRLPAQPKKDWS